MVSLLFCLMKISLSRKILALRNWICYLRIQPAFRFLPQTSVVLTSYELRSLTMVHAATIFLIKVVDSWNSQIYLQYSQRLKVAYLNQRNVQFWCLSIHCDVISMESNPKVSFFFNHPCSLSRKLCCDAVLITFSRSNRSYFWSFKLCFNIWFVFLFIRDILISSLIAVLLSGHWEAMRRTIVNNGC